MSTPISLAISAKILGLIIKGMEKNDAEKKS